jgi:mannosyltransferase OCH1-like enzyme
VIGNHAKNPGWRLNYQSDVTGASYVLCNWGDAVHAAYTCLAAGQLRADVFRFCAIWSEGGLYLDSDLEAVVPFTSMYVPCAHASLSLDVNTGRFSQMEQKQMKVFAGIPRASVARCMLDRIVDRVKHALETCTSRRRTQPDRTGDAGARATTL